MKRSWRTCVAVVDFWSRERTNEAEGSTRSLPGGLFREEPGLLKGKGTAIASRRRGTNPGRDARTFLWASALSSAGFVTTGAEPSISAIQTHNTAHVSLHSIAARQYHSRMLSHGPWGIGGRCPVAAGASGPRVWAVRPRTGEAGGASGPITAVLEPDRN